MREPHDPTVWRLREADSLEAQADYLAAIVTKLDQVEHPLPRDAEANSEARSLAGRLRTYSNDWRSEARRLRVAADELAPRMTHTTQLLTYAAVAEVWGVSVWQLKRAVRMGELTAYRMGHRSVYLKPAEVEKWIEQHRGNSGDDE